MSSFMRKREIEYKFKVGSRATLQYIILDDLGAPKNLTSLVLYDTGKFKVWKTDGTLIIDGAITFTTRADGLVSYALSAADSAANNAGVWEGEIEILNDTPIMEEQTETFTVIIEDSH